MYEMKKLLLTLLAILLLPPLVSAQNFTFTFDNIVLTYKVLDSDKQTCAVKSADKSITKAPIPPSVTYNGKEYTVTQIADSAFFECKQLTTVSIPNTVTYIGWRTFIRSALTAVTIPSSVQTIETGAFSQTPLTSVVIPNSVTRLGEFAFYKCTNLKNVTLSNSLTTITQDAFSSCSALESIILPPKITKIVDNAFANCTKLSAIYMGPNISSIGNNAFKNDVALSKIFITRADPPSMEAASFPTFTTLPSVYVPAGAKSKYTTSENWKLFATQATTSEIAATPSQLTYYDERTIYGHSPATVSSGTTSTKSYILALGNDVNCRTALKSSGVLDVSKVFWESEKPSQVYVDNNGIITCLATELETPVAVTAKSLYANGPILQVNITTGIPYTYENETLYYTVTNETTKTCSVVSAKRYAITNATIPEKAILKGKEYTVTSIGELAFFNCKGLTTVSIPNTVTSTGYRSFYGAGLTSLTIPASLRTIGDCSFEYNNFTTVEIPNSVQEMGRYAFNNCRKLTNVTIGNSIPAINNYAFRECTELESIILPPSVTSIGNYAFEGCTKLKSIYIGHRVDAIGKDAFLNTPALTDIFITAQTPPKTSAGDPFAGNYSAKLHLQNSASTATLYAGKDFWEEFSTVVEMTQPTEMSTYNHDNIYVQTPMKILFGSTGKSSFRLREGNSIKYITSLKPSGIDASKVFWKSSDPDRVSVSFDGVIACDRLIENPVTVTAESLYAGGPLLEVSISGCYPFTYNGQTLYYIVTSESNRSCAVASAAPGLSNVVIPETAEINGKEYAVTSIADYAFYNTKTTESVFIPNTVTSIGYRSFYGAGLTSLTIPSSVIRINGAAFEFNNFTTVEIPNSVREMAHYVFNGCKELTNVKISNSVKLLGYNAFSQCTALESIVLPPSITEIGTNAFDGCTMLKTIFMGPRISTIQANAFKGTNLTDVYITSEKAPVIYDTTFPAYTAKLHLQGDEAKTNYSLITDSNYWKNFKNVVKVNTPSGIKVNKTTGLRAASRAEAETTYNSSEHIYVNPDE